MRDLSSILIRSGTLALLGCLLLPGETLADSSAAFASAGPLLAQNAAEGEAPAATKSKVELLRAATFYLVVIVLIFAVGLLALRRWSRHYRKMLTREPRPDTPHEDVWAMHKLPEPESIADENDETSGPDGDSEAP